MEKTVLSHTPRTKERTQRAKKLIIKYLDSLKMNYNDDECGWTSRMRGEGVASEVKHEMGGVKCTNIT